MSRVDDLKAQYESDLKLAKLEDELAKLKEKPGNGDKLRQVKDDLRAARLEQRTAREGAE